MHSGVDFGENDSVIHMMPCGNVLAFMGMCCALRAWHGAFSYISAILPMQCT